MRALQSGAFVSGSEHAAHDRSRDGLCPQCQVPDTRQHRVCVCPRFEGCRPPGVDVVGMWEASPKCVRHHLLPSANPHLGAFKAYLHTLPDGTGNFACAAEDRARHHVFTDGSCFQESFPGFSLAAWAAISATTGKIIGCAPVHGVLQTAPRAEIMAIICVLKWAVRWQVQVTIWSDALHVVQRAQALLDGGHLPDDIGNDDLWTEVTHLINLTPEGAVAVQHVHSHLDSTLLTSPLEDWLKEWNDKADRAAVAANQNRSTAATEMFREALQHHQGMVAQIRVWRDIYFRIAAITLHDHPVCQLEEVDDLDWPERVIDWHPRTDIVAERLPVNWHLQARTVCHMFPEDFIESLLQKLIQIDGVSTCAAKVSWLELLFLVSSTSEVVFPAVCPSTGGWISAKDVPFRTSLHAAVQLRFIRAVCTRAFRLAGLSDVLCTEVDVTDFGVSMPMGGLWLGFSEAHMQAARQRLVLFTRARPVRTMSDLARPI